MNNYTFNPTKPQVIGDVISLSKRELIAAMIAQGLCAHHGLDEGIANVTEAAITIADDLLAGLAKETP